MDKPTIAPTALSTKYRGLNLWFAGLPGFPNIFVRDGIESGILLKDAQMLKNFLLYSALHQGQKYNPVTGEEPGKHPHERNPKTNKGVELKGKPGLTTEYNACDTTALWLLGLANYLKLTKDKSILKKLLPHIQRSVDYILAHINPDGLFFEDPRLTGASEFALNVTYWKDSVIPGRRKGTPAYPVVYTLAHMQNIAGLRAAVKILRTEKYDKVISNMARATDKLWDKKLKTFYIAKDSQGPIPGISSDALHTLFYLEPGDLSATRLEELLETSRVLKTKAGYRTLVAKLATMTDGYHARTIWPYEQAKIFAGARKHRIWAQRKGLKALAGKLKEIQDVSRLVMNWLEKNDHEILVLQQGKKIIQGGNNPQLWTIAAKHYFATVREN